VLSNLTVVDRSSLLSAKSEFLEEKVLILYFYPDREKKHNLTGKQEIVMVRQRSDMRKRKRILRINNRRQKLEVSPSKWNIERSNN
jgi:hypothetical protein